MTSPSMIQSALPGCVQKYRELGFELDFAVAVDFITDKLFRRILSCWVLNMLCWKQVIEPEEGQLTVVEVVDCPEHWIPGCAAGFTIVGI